MCGESHTFCHTKTKKACLYKTVETTLDLLHKFAFYNSVTNTKIPCKHCGTSQHQFHEYIKKYRTSTVEPGGTSFIHI